MTSVSHLVSLRVSDYGPVASPTRGEIDFTFDFSSPSDMGLANAG